MNVQFTWESQTGGALRNSYSRLNEAAVFSWHTAGGEEDNTNSRVTTAFFPVHVSPYLYHLLADITWEPEAKQKHLR